MKHEQMSLEQLRWMRDHLYEMYKAARRKAEASPEAQEARRKAPKDAPSQRGKGRGGARAAERAAHKDPTYKLLRSQFRKIERVIEKRLRGDKKVIRCPRCGGGPGDPSCGKTIHELIDNQ